MFCGFCFPSSPRLLPGILLRLMKLYRWIGFFKIIPRHCYVTDWLTDWMIRRRWNSEKANGLFKLEQRRLFLNWKRKCMLFTATVTERVEHLSCQTISRESITYILYIYICMYITGDFVFVLINSLSISDLLSKWVVELSGECLLPIMKLPFFYSSPVCSIINLNVVFCVQHMLAHHQQWIMFSNVLSKVFQLQDIHNFHRFRKVLALAGKRLLSFSFGETAF